jgi:hypothetical protein
MRHYAIAVSAALLLVTACFAQDGTKTETSPVATLAPTWSGNYSIDLKSKYFGSTVCAIFGDQVVAQQLLSVTRSLGDSKTTLTMTFWNSTGFHEWFQNSAYETDVYFTITHKFGKYVVAVSPWMQITYPGAGTDVPLLDTKASRIFSNGTDTFQPFVELSWFGTTNKVSYHGGFYPMVGATYARKLSRRLAVVSQFHENYDSNGGFGFRAGKSLFYSDTGLRVTLRDSLAITLPRVGVGGSWNDPDRPKKTVWSMGLSKSF